MSCGSSQSVFQMGGTACMPISIKDENGAPVNAATGPTLDWMLLNGVGVDETTVAYGITLTQVQDDTPAAITGEYILCFDASQFAAGDILSFGVSAVVNGVTLNTVKDALIKDDPNSRPSIC